MAIGEALGNIIGGFLGANASKMDRSKAKDMAKQALQYYQDIGLPPDYSKQLVLQEFQRQGIYTPELEQDLSDTLQESQVAKIQEDPALRQAGLQALQMMQARGKVGLSAEDRAALNQVRQETQRDAEAKRQQIMQQMQARGMGGAGAELASQLQAAQSAADQAATGSSNLMAQAQQRALEALGQSSSMAQQMRSQDFNINEAKARAIDERNRMLLENSIARQRANVGALNTAQQANLKEQQRIADANVQQANEEKRRQMEAKQAQYGQKLNWAAGASGQASGLSDYYAKQAEAKAQQQKDTAKGIGGLVDSGAKLLGGLGG